VVDPCTGFQNTATAVSWPWWPHLDLDLDLEHAEIIFKVFSNAMWLDLQIHGMLSDVQNSCFVCCASDFLAGCQANSTY
jgi:hypothetical protein